MSSLQPKSVLDIGVGWGTFGVLVREKTDAMAGRFFKKDWEVYLAGVEVYEPYTKLPHVKAIYSQVFNADIVDFVRRYEQILGEELLPETWDLIHAGDVIEHLEKEDGKKVLEWCVTHCKNFILQIPLGEVWAEHTPDPAMWHDQERHRAAWFLHEFSGWVDALTIPTPRGAVLCAWWRFE